MRYLVLALLVLAPLSAAQAIPPKNDPLKDCLKKRIVDGRYTGFTWKASGAHTVKAVMILPERFVEHTKLATLLRKRDLRVIEASMYCKGDGVCLPGQAECVGRPSYMMKLSGGFMKNAYGSLIVRAIDDKNKCVYWVIPDPSKYYD